MRIPEELLHFIWRFQLFRPFHLQTSCGKSVEVISPGRYNVDAGPDFLFSELLIDKQRWYGHVELHVESKEWMLHRHHQDPAYNSVILHVVWTGDSSCYLSDGTWIPNLILNNQVEEGLLGKAMDLLHNGNWLACAYRMKHIPMHVKLQAIQRSAVERLESKTMQIMTLLERYNGDWERVTLSLIAGSFGFKVNKQAFLDWSELISLRILSKISDKPLQIQAMFFGQAGYLNAYKGKDSYVLNLKNEYHFLKHSNGLSEMTSFQWKFLRMRPYNFPTLKMAQLAGLYSLHINWFSRILNVYAIEDLKQEIRDIVIPTFWRRHYHFEKCTDDHNTALTEAFLDILAINCFAPLLFAYGKHIRQANYMDKAMEWLERIAAEDNVISRNYRKAGLPSYSAMESQGLIHLQSNYCDVKRCLSCPIGAYILQQPLSF